MEKNRRRVMKIQCDNLVGPSFKVLTRRIRTGCSVLSLGVVVFLVTSCGPSNKVAIESGATWDATNEILAGTDPVGRVIIELSRRSTTAPGLHDPPIRNQEASRIEEFYLLLDGLSANRFPSIQWLSDTYIFTHSERARAALLIIYNEGYKAEYYDIESSMQFLFVVLESDQNFSASLDEATRGYELSEEVHELFEGLGPQQHPDDLDPEIRALFEGVAQPE